MRFGILSAVSILYTILRNIEFRPSQRSILFYNQTLRIVLFLKSCYEQNQILSFQFVRKGGGVEHML